MEQVGDDTDRGRQVYSE